VVEIDPAPGTSRLLLDQPPGEWRHLVTSWTSSDWILLSGVDHWDETWLLVDVRTGATHQFRLEGIELIVEPS
jgi:hypothetical protein